MTFPGLEMAILKFHDFSRFSMTVRTLWFWPSGQKIFSVCLLQKNNNIRAMALTLKWNRFSKCPEQIEWSTLKHYFYYDVKIWFCPKGSIMWQKKKKRLKQHHCSTLHSYSTFGPLVTKVNIGPIFPLLYCDTKTAFFGWTNPEKKQYTCAKTIKLTNVL